MPTIKVMSVNDVQDENILTDGTHAYLHCVYLHGKVESAIGYDIVVCCNPNIFEMKPIFDTYRVDIPDGIYPCEVYNYEGTCNAYIWHRTLGGDPEIVGLIIDANSAEDVNFAKERYDKKRKFI